MKKNFTFESSLLPADSPQKLTGAELCLKSPLIHHFPRCEITAGFATTVM